MTDNESSGSSSITGRFFRAIGPAFITASVVIGPGSILASTKVGANFGYSLIWMLAGVVLLMIGMVALSARLGVVLERPFCAELSHRIGRPIGLLAGLTVFFVVAGFQFSNNIGVLAAFDALFAEVGFGSNSIFSASNLVILATNILIVAFLFGFKKLYAAVEKLMMALVGLMVLGFVGNLIYMLGWQGASLPEGAEPASIISPEFTSMIALTGTTLSIAAVFYQGYLAREKGWTLDEVRNSLIDSATAITVLGVISLVVMVTSALTFFGQDGVSLSTPGQVAQALEPAFGRGAVVLFGLGLFAGAFSSFLVNAMIGGTLLADGLGLDARMDGMATKVCTVLGLLSGMIVAMFVPAEAYVNIIVFAQAMVVLGFPILAFAMLYLATRPDLPHGHKIPLWMKIVSVVTLVVVLGSAAHTAYGIYTTLAG